ncbi:hypothetical protein AURDEDRAFT_114393 [Auricularia subglabra TFB-10046 SS5]|nr:hypothetical protein AURDEDRAFT_114393 [Auricularia subglabra TFB-10046 SS5]
MLLPFIGQWTSVQTICVAWSEEIAELYNEVLDTPYNGDTDEGMSRLSVLCLEAGIRVSLTADQTSVARPTALSFD